MSGAPSDPAGRCARALRERGPRRPFDPRGATSNSDLPLRDYAVYSHNCEDADRSIAHRFARRWGGPLARLHAADGGASGARSEPPAEGRTLLLALTRFSSCCYRIWQPPARRARVDVHPPAFANPGVRYGECVHHLWSSTRATPSRSLLHHAQLRGVGTSWALAPLTHTRLRWTKVGTMELVYANEGLDVGHGGPGRSDGSGSVREG